MISEADLKLAAGRVALARALQHRRILNPADWYEPSRPSRRRPWANQLGFHRSTHPIRLLVPGNGWGKTTAMGAECHAWAMHTNEWAKTPPWPVLMVWFCKLKKQFEIIRQQLSTELFGQLARWSDDTFTWPDGSKLWLGLADDSTDWVKWQGVAIDLACFDEQPRLSLWREMTMRRRVRRKTRYVIAATATEGESWMEAVLYQPWLEHHKGLGLDEARAMRVQKHPDIYVWSRGGIEDNPASDQEDVRWYDEVTKGMHPNERKVRRRGGFARWVGDPVFDAAALEWLEAQIDALDATRGPGMLGLLEPAQALPREAR